MASGVRRISRGTSRSPASRCRYGKSSGPHGSCPPRRRQLDLRQAPPATQNAQSRADGDLVHGLASLGVVGVSFRVAGALATASNAPTRLTMKYGPDGIVPRVLNPALGELVYMRSSPDRHITPLTLG